MPFSMYQASVPALTRGLKALSALLTKGEADAKARDFAPDVLLHARLAPDMYDLTRQVQVVSDIAKSGAGRLAGIELPSFPDTESTLEELHERITKTVAFLDGITEAQFDGSEGRTIVLKFPGGEMPFIGTDYLTNFVLPNFYFHLAAAYNILRQNGVKIGKRDFMGF